MPNAIRPFAGAPGGARATRQPMKTNKRGKIQIAAPTTDCPTADAQVTGQDSIPIQVAAMINPAKMSSARVRESRRRGLSTSTPPGWRSIDPTARAVPRQTATHPRPRAITPRATGPGRTDDFVCFADLAGFARVCFAGREVPRLAGRRGEDPLRARERGGADVRDAMRAL
jgi:hypothetical protein